MHLSRETGDISLEQVEWKYPNGTEHLPSHHLRRVDQ